MNRETIANAVRLLALPGGTILAATVVAGAIYLALRARLRRSNVLNRPKED